MTHPALLIAALLAGEPAPDHWAYRPPAADVPPVTPDARGPIDAFLADAWRRHGLTPAAHAEPSLLYRRLHLDLIGLPPTRDELRRFLADDAPDAWERAVDRSLASPRHGERWARHWMDVWRYSDWYGLGEQLRDSQKHIWHWRDWVRESLDADAGYDQMVRLMLAADELAPADSDALRATGFLARNYYLFNRTTWLDNTIEHTSKAFLGLTMNCAKCHDHKYDPVTQEDYYRFRAIFEPHQIRLDSVPGQTDLEKDGIPRAFDAHPDAVTHLHVRGEEKLPDTSRALEPGVPAFLSPADWRVEPVALPAEAHAPQLRPFVLADHLAGAEREIADARRALAAAEAALARSAGRSADSPRGAVAFRDEFDAERPDVWEVGDGEWSITDGRLVQRATGPARRTYRMRSPHPRDFAAVVRFRVTGGEKWKSVGLSFDAGPDRDVLAYLSAVTPGSKAQIAVRDGADYRYPEGGWRDRPVEVGRWYRLTVAVRDRLVNLAVDGEHVLAYRLSADRRPGRLELVSFDSSAEFDSVEVRALADGAELIEPGSAAPATPDRAEADRNVARLALAAAEMRPEAIRAAHAADRARTAGSTDAPALVAAAALAARRLELASAELAVARAELEDASGREAASKSARARLDQARQRLGSPGGSYLTLTASLKALEGPDETDASRRAAYPAVSTGRRSALAAWITRRDNPLTARVAVNHVWMRHFGQPLVEPADDFGPNTPAPPLRPVLDRLAVEFMDHDWSMKWLHREMVTSAAYRLATGPDLASPYLAWRRPGRVEAEVVRDSILHLAGALEERLGGPTVDPKDAHGRRRGLYFTHSRDDQNRFLSMFDSADIFRCYRREESVVPQQALALANGRLPLEMSRLLAERFGHEGGRAGFVRAAFETVLSREPTEAEAEACLGLFDAIPDERRARAALVLALFNHNDFVTIR